MKRVFVRFIVFAYLAVLLVGILTVGVGAASSYETFTYSTKRKIQNSPNAYEVYRVYNADLMKLGNYKDKYVEKRAKYEVNVNGESEENASKVAENAWKNTSVSSLSKPNAIRADKDGKIYIADTDNNRIVILKNDYTFYDAIDYFTSTYTQYDSFNKPKGVFVNDEAIYVSDTGNKRILVFSKSDLTKRATLINRPDNPLVEEADWQPSACAVDQYGRVFVISEMATNGVLSLSYDTKADTYIFNGYIGAQKTNPSLFEIFWRRFQSEEQRKSNSKVISPTLSNITIDADGFIYVTTDKIEEADQVSAITSKKADYSPVKKLNSAGKHILQRNGFFDCGGEVYLHRDGDESNQKVSRISDVAVGPEGSWSICDKNRGRVYTYNSNGELLFAFGDGGTGSGSTGKLGSLTTLQSMTYQLAPNQDDDAEIPTYNLILLDSFNSLFTVFTRTAYGDLLMEALAQENNRKYDNAEKYWMRILQRNNNFDTAYIGVGKALYRQGKYTEAQDYFKVAYETSYYSKAYSELRKDWIAKPGHLILILVVVVGFVILVVKGLGAAKKFNTRVSLKPGKKTYWEELVYPCHLLFHPFDGFWDLKHEKRGSVRGGLTIMGLTILAFYYKEAGQGYIADPYQNKPSILAQIVLVTLPVLLWVTANWCLTTLFDGEGSYRDVFVATTYSLAPLPPLIVISTLLTNVLTESEGAIATMIFTIGLIWVGYLIFFGMLVTHGYSLPKNIITTLGTILALAVLIFVAGLFTSLVAKMVQFVSNIVIEVSSRA